ncbi:MAG: phosphatase PAP2 family protein [Eubacterium sp.]
MIGKYKNNIIIFYIIAGLSLIISAFVDLKLDIILNNPENPFAIWFRNTGEIPVYLICPLAGCILFYLCKSKIFKAAGFLINLGGSAFLGYYICDYFFIDDKNKIPFGIVFGIGIGLIILMTGKYISVPKSLKKPLIILAIAGISAMLAEISIIQILKVLWGRVRFRDLIAAGSYEAFTAWYHPNGINGNMSFPSGHTAGAGMSYLMMLLPFVSDKWMNRKNLCFIIPLVYTSIVAFTRLVMGAHYLSDVTMGGALSFTIIIITIKIIEEKTVIKEQV